MFGVIDQRGAEESGEGPGGRVLTSSLQSLVSCIVLVLLCAPWVHDAELRVCRRRERLVLVCAVLLFSNGLHAARDCNRSLYSNTLTGTIPASIASLPALKQLCVCIKLAVASLLCGRVRAEGAQRRFSLFAGALFFISVRLLFPHAAGYLARSKCACVHRILCGRRLCLA